VVNGVIVSDAAIPRGTKRRHRAGGTNIAETSQANGVDDESNTVNRIADLNPNDIRERGSAEGASASAIYGSKASNGVIIITTKKGRSGFRSSPLTQRTVAPGWRRSTAPGASATWPRPRRCKAGSAPTAPRSWRERATTLNRNCWAVLPSRTRPRADERRYETTRYYASVLNKHEGGIVPATFANKQSLTLNVDQNIASRLQLSISSQAIHTSNDRGLTSNENNGSTLQSSYYGLPSWIDWRGTCPDASRVIDPGKPCAGATWAYASPYASSNAFQDRGPHEGQGVGVAGHRVGRVQLDFINSGKHTFRFIGTGAVTSSPEGCRARGPPAPVRAE